MNICQCGCGLECNNRFKKGHARKNKFMSEEHKLKISLGNKGKVRSIELVEKLRILNTGRNHTQETKDKMSKIAKEKGFGKWMTGKKISDETIKKIIETRKNNNFKHSDITKKKISIANSGANNGMFGKTMSEKDKKIKSKIWKEMWKYQRDIFLKHPDRVKNCRKGALVSNSKYQKFPFTNTIQEMDVKDIFNELNINYKHNHPIDFIEHSYCCDFYLTDFNVILEVDGSSHYNKKHIEKDNLRLIELNEKGVKLFRIKNEDVNKINIINFLNEINS